MVKLPSELWRNILSLAVNEPLSFLPAWDSCSWNSPVVEDIRMKLAICRVCRLFHAIGTEFLYNHLHFPRSSYDEIEHIATVFEQHRHETGYVYGHATKRIDVRVECLASRLDVQPLLRLLRSVQNLAVLVFIPHPSDTFMHVTASRTIPIFDPVPMSQVSRVLEQRFKQTLRCLSLGISLSSLDGGVLPELPLKTLELAMSQCHLDPHPCTATVTSLTLDLNLWPESDPLVWHFPSLKELTLKSMTMRDRPRIEPFLKLNGSLITFLNIIPFKGSRGINHIAYFLNACPQLHHLALPNHIICYHKELADRVEGPRIFSGITAVSIQFSSGGYWLPSIFDTIKELFPNVECIRHDLQERYLEAGMLPSMRTLQALGVKLEPGVSIEVERPTPEDILTDCAPGLISGP